MSRIVRAILIVAPFSSLGCGDDEQTPAGSGTGGELIFNAGGSSGSGTGTGGGTSGAPAGNGGSGTSGGSSNGGASSSNGGTTSDGGSSSGNGGSAAGSPSSGGTNPTGTGGATAGGGSSGSGPTGLPIGALCANDTNCAPNVCCKVPACAGPCECQPASNCPTSTSFLPCNSAADCATYGGGKVCCRASAGSQSMQYCTKPSGCSGTTLP